MGHFECNLAKMCNYSSTSAIRHAQCAFQDHVSVFSEEPRHKNELKSMHQNHWEQPYYSTAVLMDDSFVEET